MKINNRTGTVAFPLLLAVGFILLAILEMVQAGMEILLFHLTHLFG
jgi:hypothetical protein